MLEDKPRATENFSREDHYRRNVYEFNWQGLCDFNAY